MKKKVEKSKAQVDPDTQVFVQTEAEGGNSLVFGIVIDVNGTEVPISTDDIKNFKTKGFDFKLPQPVHLGSFDDLFKYLKDNYGVDIPSPADLPSPLNDMVGAITSLVFTVEQLAFHIPGTESPAGDKRTYTLRLAGAWAEAKEIIPGIPLKLKGGVFGVTNMPNTQQADNAITISRA